MIETKSTLVLEQNRRRACEAAVYTCLEERISSQVIRQCRRVDAARLEADADDSTGRVKAKSAVSISSACSQIL